MTSAGDIACPHCGATNTATAQFCEACGKALPSAAPSGPRVVSADALPQTAVGHRLVGADLVKTQKQAATALLWVAILQTFLGPVMLFVQKGQMERQNPGMVYEIQPFAWAVIFGIAAAFWILYFWARRSPLPAAIVGLILFITIHALDAIADPTALLKGWILKIIVVVALVKGIEAALKHRRLMETEQAG